MGIRRGAYESATLGDAAKSVKPSTVELNSVQTGMNAMAAGTKAYANAMGGLAKTFEFAGKVCKQFADYTTQSRKEVAENDKQRDSAYNEYKTIVEKEGPDSENAKRAWNKVENIQDRRSTLGIMSFGSLGDPNNGYKRYEESNQPAPAAQ